MKPGPLILTAGIVVALGFRPLEGWIEEQRRTSRLASLGSTPALPAASNPAYAAGVTDLLFRGGGTGIRVGIQAGHWRQDELPAELARLRGSTGAAGGGYTEAEVNLATARELEALLVSAGIQVDLLPSTVPPGYLADALISIHADGAARPGARGWKVAAPWRASEASLALERAVSESYALLSGLPEDRYGVTYGMKGYYAFSPHRVRHAISPFTPAVIVETGFLTMAADRAVIVDRPQQVARALAAGILRYLAERDPLDRAALVSASYPAMQVRTASATLRMRPGEAEPVAAVLEEGTLVLPLQVRQGWVEVMVRGSYRIFGWLPAEQLGTT